MTDLDVKLNVLIERLQNRDSTSELYFLAIAGMPGAGKTTVAEKIRLRLNEMIPDAAVVLPMDGFHYYRKELDAFEDPVTAHARRGAPFTFNAKLFYETLVQIKTDHCGFAPSFDHARGDPEEKTIESHKVVIVEGLYLFLVNETVSEYWRKLGGLFDEKWYLSVTLDTARERVVKRHMKEWNFTKEQALARWNESDSLNAIFVQNDIGGQDGIEHIVAKDESVL